MSRLYSNSDKPYLDYRTAEKCFITAFDAADYTRSCVAIDAKVGTIGVGIKTFVDTPFQKIAEFDEKSHVLNGDPEHDARAIAVLRNERMELARDAYGITDFIYHYILRTKGQMSIHEEPMLFIDIDKIRIIKARKQNFDFTDGRCTYRFSRSKSTLYKKFDWSDPLAFIGVAILDDIIDQLEATFGVINMEEPIPEIAESIILPLFSTRGGRHVPERSGLNQWNAKGRPRDPNEVYIPLPVSIKKKHEDFFPERKVHFSLVLPDGQSLDASVCQDNGKAIMSNPNSDLGRWILRTVLKLEPRELVTIDKLDDLGIDAVVFTKYDDHYKIDFTYIGDGRDEEDDGL